MVLFHILINELRGKVMLKGVTYVQGNNQSMAESFQQQMQQKQQKAQLN